MRREYMAAHQRRYRKQHPDRVKATDLKRSKDDRAKQKKAFRISNPELHKVAQRRSYLKHKTKRLHESREWKKLNKEASSLHSRSAKAKRRAAVGSFNKADIASLFEKQNAICAACQKDISTKYHIDHITPLARGGTNWPNNLQLLCPPCNQSKGTKTMSQWSAWKLNALKQEISHQL